MKTEILSLNVGMPQDEEWNGHRVRTSMRKSPVSALAVGPTSIEGDGFAHPAHGTPDKASFRELEEALR